MTRILVAASLAMTLAACGGAGGAPSASTLNDNTVSAPARAAKPTWRRHAGMQDYFTVDAPEGTYAPVNRDATDCRAHIAEVMCLSNGGDPETTGEPECEPGGEAYAAVFQTIHDQVPPTLQRMFCSIQKLYVLRHFEATAFAGTVRNPDGTTAGSVMGIRKSVLDEGLTLSRWSTWKEQLNFGGIVGSYSDVETLPRHDASTRAGVNDFLYMVVAHEFGHMFDFANELNHYDPLPTPPVTGDDDERPSARFSADSWGALSWITDDSVKLTSQFPYRRGLCFYSCGREPMSAAAVPELYRGLYESNFISAYAATNAWDDLAETLAYMMMNNNLNATFEIDTRQGVTYDMMAKFRSPRMAEKRQYLASFLARRDIRYP